QQQPLPSKFEERLRRVAMPGANSFERSHKALQQQTVRDPKYNNNNTKTNSNKKKNYLYLAATRCMTSLIFLRGQSTDDRRRLKAAKTISYNKQTTLQTKLQTNNK
ncbi:unnamed protein product, partial [Polarella glacialis]